MADNVLDVDSDPHSARFHLVPTTFWHENVKALSHEYNGHGLRLCEVTARAFRGVTQLDVDTFSEFQTCERPVWVPSPELPVDFLPSSNLYDASAIGQALSLPEVLESMPEKSFFLRALISSIEIREFVRCPQCRHRADLLEEEEDGSVYECADCGATFEEATMISFAIITLGEADGADTVLEASAWDRMQDIASNF